MADEPNENEVEETEQTTPEAEATADGDDGQGKGSLANVLADLAKERKRRQAAEAKVADYEDRDKSELDKAVARAERAERALLDKTREAIAASKGIPGELAGAIQGETEAEMEASALLFAKYVGTADDKRQQQSPTQRPGRRGAPVAPAKAETADDWLRAKFRGED
jgi:hypothetical protein